MNSLHLLQVPYTKYCFAFPSHCWKNCEIAPKCKTLLRDQGKEKRKKKLSIRRDSNSRPQDCEECVLPLCCTSAGCVMWRNIAQSNYSDDLKAYLQSSIPNFLGENEFWNFNFVLGLQLR